MSKLSNRPNQWLFIAVTFLLLYISLYGVLYFLPEQSWEITPEFSLEYTTMVVFIGFLVALSFKKSVFGLTSLLLLIYATIYPHWLLLAIPTGIVMYKVLFKRAECNQDSVRPYLYASTAICAMIDNNIPLKCDLAGIGVIFLVTAIFWFFATFKIPKINDD